ncbi:MAG: LLM class F420-dependent oxidoreductase [Dehalococcoidia bacterium]|nr:LLM class F420-dependent oxidoreductase [Dehalococcoidia bacterium]
MKFGAFMFPTEYSMEPAALGRAMEERGYESVFFPEHTHIPASRLTPYPLADELPQEYYNALDPFVALSAVAAVTERLRLGTGVCLVVEHHPITLAKTVATLDIVSGGRVLFGIGAGWNREEMENHGTDPSRRWKLMRERIEAMKRIWTEDEAEYHGEFVDFDRIWQWPKPVQKPHPPILLGNNPRNALRRVVRYADGWMPNGINPKTFPQRIQQLNELAEEAGRGPIPVTMFGTPPQAEAVEHFAEVGVERCILPLPPAPAEEVMPLLDAQARLIEQFS